MVSSVAFAQEEAPAEAVPPVEEPAAETPPADADPEGDEEAVAAEAADEEVDPEPEPALEPEPEPEPAEPEPEPVAEEPVEAPAAPSLLPLKVGTHTWTRWEIRENYDELGVSRPRFGEGDSFFFRTRLSLETNPLQLTEDIQGLVNVTPQAAGQWGTSGLGGTIGAVDAGLYEGYFLVRGKHLTGKVGRFAMNYGDAMVIGNLDWHQAGRAFDGVHFSAKPGGMQLDFFLTQTAEGQPLMPEPFAGDTYFYGAYAMVGPMITEGLDLDVYALGLTNAAADFVDPVTTMPWHRDASTFGTFGARVKQKVAMFDYRLEGGIQYGTSPGGPPAGESRDTFAYMADGEVGITPIEGFHAAIGGLFVSGDDLDTADEMEGWNELFPTGHKFLGLMDVIGARTNVVSGNVKLSANAGPTTTIQLDGHVFARVEDGGLGRVPDSDAFAGVEIDTQVVQKIGQWAYTRGLLGVFVPNAGHYASDTTALYGEIQAGLKF